jgi:protein-tyrosine-phosphatase
MRTILFSCATNSYISLLAEALLRQDHGGYFKVLSAGIVPAEKVHPHLLALLQQKQISADKLEPKSFDVFREGEHSVPLHGIITLDEVSEKAAPLWPGMPRKVRWHLDDPLTAANDEQLAWKSQKAFLKLQRLTKLMAAGGLPDTAAEFAMALIDLDRS